MAESDKTSDFHGTEAMIFEPVSVRVVGEAVMVVLVGDVRSGVHSMSIPCGVGHTQQAMLTRWRKIDLYTAVRSAIGVSRLLCDQNIDKVTNAFTSEKNKT